MNQAFIPGYNVPRWASAHEASATACLSAVQLWQAGGGVAWN